MCRGKDDTKVSMAMVVSVLPSQIRKTNIGKSQVVSLAYLVSLILAELWAKLRACERAKACLLA